MRFLIFWICVLFLLSCFGVGKALYHEDNTVDIYNITNNKITWNSSIWDEQREEMFYNTTSINTSVINMIHLKNIIYKGIDFYGYVSFEITKWGIEVGFENPQYNYQVVIKWLFYFAIFIIILTLFPILPILLALIYLSYVGIKKLVLRFKEFNKKRLLES